MKTFLRLVSMSMLVLFMSACGSSGGSSGGGASNDNGTNDNAVDGAVESGKYTTSFNGGADKTWYTWRKSTPENYVVNTASYNANVDSDGIYIGASSKIGTDNSDGVLIFTLFFPSKITTGNLVLGQVQYQDTEDGTRYIYLENMLGADIVANITEATNVNDIVHLKGSFSGTIYDGTDDAGNPKDPQSLSVNFEFDAHRTDITY